MKIFICCSKHVYSKVPPIKRDLEYSGHIVTLPNSYDNPGREQEMRDISDRVHAEWKGEMICLQKTKVRDNDGVLVLNYEKNGQPNYIGGATFLEMYMAWDEGKKLYLMNPIPANILKDEIEGFSPVIINGDLSLIGL